MSSFSSCIHRVVGLIAIAISAWGCSADGEALGSSQEALLARRGSLWPLVGHVAPIRVCWTEPLLGSTFAAPGFAPVNAAQIVAWGKARVREAAEREWNTKTPLRFVGFADCNVDPNADFALTPIDSSITPDCGGRGQACAQGLGTEIRGRQLFINVFFGFEAFYASTYFALAGANADPKVAPDFWWLPQFCMDELKEPWTADQPNTSFRFDIRRPDVVAAFSRIYDNCLQGNAIHELGHAAGFGHEQYREDDPHARAACKSIIEARGIGDDFVGTFAGAAPLGPFDFESIMSYCRRDKRATLTASDVIMANVAYRFLQ